MNDLDVFNLAVHRHADLFPMLSDEELDELAEDIKKNGLRYPLVVQEIDEVLTLIDGRNRREACRRAGVVPATTTLNGGDAVAYILSTNINRRHMTVGQRAMAVAMILPEEEEESKPKGGRGKKSEALKLGGSAQFKRRINEARFILEHRPLLASLVLSGNEKLDTPPTSRRPGPRGAKSANCQCEQKASGTL